MRSRHTPGPWELSGQFWLGDRPARAVYRPGDTAETRILILGAADRDCDADGAMVAACTALYEALRDVLPIAERNESSPAIERARAALALATTTDRKETTR